MSYVVCNVFHRRGQRRADDWFAAPESQRESICSQSQNSWLGGQPRLNLQVQQSSPIPRAVARDARQSFPLCATHAVMTLT